MKVAMVSLGCDKNRIDSEEMLGLLRSGGFEITTDVTEADAVVVNTCGFIADAVEESVDAILEAAQTMKDEAVLAVVGCLVERYGDELQREIPEIDLLLRPSELAEILPAISERLGYKPAAAQRGRVLSTPPYLAYVRIAEGCNNLCTFCTIPSIRGPFRSRPPAEIVAEVRDLAARGVKEVVLVAQNTGDYGRDLDEHASLPVLLKGIARVEGVRWVRLLYCYPGGVTPELLEVMASEPRIVEYLDIPLQHGSAKILRAMGRRSEPRELIQLVEEIRRRVPAISLRTSLIVGFPGETEEDFARLLEFTRRIAFDYVGTFIYSHEEGTAAARLPGHLPRRIKEERRRRLMAEQLSITRARHASRIGQLTEAIVEGVNPSDPASMLGRTRWQAPEVDGHTVILGSGASPGEIVPVRIVGYDDYDLIAEIVQGGNLMSTS